MSQIAWYLKRIRIMTIRELMFRIRQQLTLLSLLGQYMFSTGMVRPPADSAEFGFCTSREARLPTLAFDIVALKQASNTLLKGEIQVANGAWRWEDSVESWHRAPDTGRSWPRRFFGSINYREGNSFGDVRQLWEPSRLQQLVNLALLADASSGSERDQAVQMVRTQLDSWVEFNPPLAGVHYISAMECALRMIAVCHTLDILRDDLGDSAPWEVLVRIIASHAPLIERRLSLHSSAGNHTVAEAAGLVYAGLLFPEMTGAKRWLETGTSILADAARTQVLPDGGGVEQALRYHLFNIQLLSLVEALLEHCGRQAQIEISEAVNRGNRFLGALALDGGRLPPIGDGDSGHALSEYLRFAVNSDEPITQARTFHDSGYTVAHIGSTASVRVVFDHGSLGMAPAYGHGHADALSLILSSDGKDVLVDTGTYTYTGDQDWRRYFRGTRAHNTVTVDGKDQALQNGCFLWSRPFRARLLASEIDESACGRLVAEHDGYCEAGVRHARGIAWMRDQWLIVWDGLFGDGVHDLALHWHMTIPPNWHGPDTFDLQLPGGAVTVRCQGGRISSHSGERAPITGWRSPSYGTIEPITTMRLHRHGYLPHAFTTLIMLPGSHPPENAIEEALQWMNDSSR